MEKRMERMERMLKRRTERRCRPLFLCVTLSNTGNSWKRLDFCGSLWANRARNRVEWQDAKDHSRGPTFLELRCSAFLPQNMKRP